MRLPSLFFALLSCLALCACERAGGGASLPASSPSRFKAVKATVRVEFPHRTRRRGGASHYVSASTKSVRFTLTTVDGGSVPAGYTTGVTVTLGTGCTDSSGTYTCTTAWTVPAGSDAFTVVAYDGSNATGSELSRNTVTKSVSSGSNTIAVTLDGIPASVVVSPVSGSTIAGSMGAGFAATKCGSPQSVDVYGVDADGNDIVGAGAPTPSLSSSNTAVVSVATPPPSTPNQFTLTYAIEHSSTGVELTAGATPLSGSGGSAQTATVSLTVDGSTSICGIVTEFSTGLDASAQGRRIVEGPDGNLWFADAGSRIGRITTAGVITEFTSGIAGASDPIGIAEGSDGNLWFTQLASVGRITTSATVTEFSTGIVEYSGPTENTLMDIAAGSDHNLWFTEYCANRIGRITTAGTITEFTAGLSARSFPWGIAAGPDGNLWFTEYGGGRIGRITTGGTITEFSTGLTAGAAPGGIVQGPDANLWFTEQSGDKIGKITTGGTITEYSSGISSGAWPSEIAVGPDGNLWFTEYDGNRLGRITTGGTVTEFSIPTAATAPYGITTGPDGNLWFTQEACECVGRMQ
ncbi:MAG TPA: hypothetical protein VMH02_07295 [Verrucomicrobiae bacterium]|nr:hypothetical protein [Verrucomicrobiae bacterium]